jgi:type IV pilus assembly protein PilW
MTADRTVRFECVAPRPAGRTAGFTLVELMVALAIASVLLLALAAMFIGTSMSRSELDKSSRQIEGGRYAVQVLSDEIRHAGWYGALANAPALPGSVTSLPDPCSNTLATVQDSIGLPLQGYAGGASSPLTCINAAAGYKPGTAVIVVRRADTSIAAATATSPYFNIQTSGCAGDSIAYIFDKWDTGSFTLHSNASPGCLPLISAPTAKIAPVYIRIFYISTCSQSSCTAAGADSVPTLKRIDLTESGTTTPVSIIDGIENMQFEYGIDTAGSDGTPDSYVTTPATTAVSTWTNVMAVRLYLIARNIDTTPGYSDTKTYSLGLAGTFTPTGSATAYRRHAYSALVRVNNPSGRRECSTC